MTSFQMDTMVCSSKCTVPFNVRIKPLISKPFTWKLAGIRFQENDRIGGNQL